MEKNLEDLIKRLPSLKPCVPDIELAYSALRTGLATDGKVLLCGNGGSAADAGHWAAELLKSFRRPRPIDDFWHAKLGPRLSAQLEGALPAIALPDFAATLTAFGNDRDPAYAYAQLVWALGKPADVLVGISTSGNAQNVVLACQAATALDMIPIGLTGAAGGDLAEVVDICIRVPATEVAQVQEYHLPIYHCLAAMLEDEFFG